jgi:hypothetical protein
MNALSRVIAVTARDGPIFSSISACGTVTTLA